MFSPSMLQYTPVSCSIFQQSGALLIFLALRVYVNALHQYKGSKGKGNHLVGDEITPTVRMAHVHVPVPFIILPRRPSKSGKPHQSWVNFRVKEKRKVYLGVYVLYCDFAV